MNTEEWIRLRLPVLEPGDPTITINLSLLQATDLLEAYKASRFRRPHTREIVGALERAIRTATEFP